MLYFYISMFCTDTCHKQPLGEVLHSVEICFVMSLLKDFKCIFQYQRTLALVILFQHINKDGDLCYQKKEIASAGSRSIWKTKKYLSLENM